MAGQFPKDFNLIKMDLTSVSGKTQGLRFVMLECNVYEDLNNNHTTCDITINDAKNMLINFPAPEANDGIFGYETLDLAFQTPDQGTWEKQFRLIGITNRKLIREREMVYILHFVTAEAIQNLHTRVSKSYKGLLISDIVQDIHTNLMQGDTINVEPTQYQHHIIIPNIHPCHAINWLATRANSATYKGANYLYYQDKDQFNFVSVESLLQQNSAKSYLFQVANIRKDTADGYKSQDVQTDQIAAETYSFDNFSNILENMQAGMYGNQLYTHSQVRKRWDHYEFDYPSSFDTYKHLYAKNLLWSSKGLGAPINSPNSRLKLHPDGPPDFLFRPESWIPIRISQLQQIDNVRLTLTIPGDSDRTVGEVIEFNLPSPEPTQNLNQINDKYYRGRFLVTSVRHKIDVDKYITILQLIKDSTFESYPLQ